jgi:hypothetical protein
MAEISPLRRRMIDDTMARTLLPARQQSYIDGPAPAIRLVTGASLDIGSLGRCRERVHRNPVTKQCNDGLSSITSPATPAADALYRMFLEMTEGIRCQRESEPCSVRRPQGSGAH